MIRTRSLSIAFLLVSLSSGALSQSPRQSMSQMIEALPWDAAKDGPLVAPVPLRIASGTTLDDIDRRKAVVGGLTAIVPKTMATVNSRFTTPPNMYEGMPQDAKVLYLLRGLNPTQWSKAAGDGISLDDLQGEQRAVFDSILPNPLRYSMGTLVDSRGITNPNGPGDIITMKPADRAKVKLRVLRHLSLHVSLENDGGFTGTEPEGEEKPGTKMPFIVEDKDSEFGQRVIVRGPNVPRKSQLNLEDSRLGAAVTLKQGERVKELLERIGTATGLRFVADPHYAPMMMVEKGTSATARDLLAALSLGVTGTYRRVGDTYVLTADLEGMGAHATRVAVWEDMLKKVVDDRTRQWRQEIAKGSGFNKIGFRSPVYDGLTEAEKANLEANERPNNQPVYIPIGQASKPIADAIRNWKFGNRIDKERVGVTSNVRYQILLPGLGRAWWEGWLGNTDQYREKPYTWTPPNPPPVPLPLDGSPGVAGLVLHADTPADAKRLVSRVAKLGVPELWLEAREAATLAAAVEAGKAANVKVSLAVRPWVVAPQEHPADPDRTIAGEHGSGLAASKAAIAPLQNFWMDEKAFEPPTRELIAPLDPATNAHVAWAAGLARTPGLAKTVVLDLYSPGYGKADSFSSGSYWYSNPIDGYLAYGYTDALRSAYLKAEGVDPIDLETQMLRTDIEFGPAWGMDFTNAQGFDKWQAAKGKWSHARALALVRALRAADPARPLLMMGEPPQNYLPPLPATSLYRWEGTEELPLAPVDYGGGEVPEAAEVQLLLLSDDRDPAQRNRVASRLKEMLGKGKKPVVLDLSSVPSTRLEAVLTRWLRDKRP